jgi:hypothetical protein
MAVTIVTTLTYPRSDTPNDRVNKDILNQELSEASLSVSVLGISISGTDIRIDLSGNASVDDETAINSVIAAHQGSDFSTTTQSSFSEAASSDDTNGIIEKTALSTGLLPAGTYLMSWYMELATTTTTGTTGARGFLNVSKNGAAAVERAQSNNDLNQWVPMSGSLPVTVVDGDSYSMSLSFQRIGIVGNAARAQRARLTLSKIG